MGTSTRRKNPKKRVGCPVETTLAAIGGRWKVLVIHHLLEEKRRFGELAKLLHGVSARTLTRQLREMEESGLVVRNVFADGTWSQDKADVAGHAGGGIGDRTRAAKPTVATHRWRLIDECGDPFRFGTYAAHC